MNRLSGIYQRVKGSASKSNRSGSRATVLPSLAHRAGEDCFRISEHASTARPEVGWSLAASGFASGLEFYNPPEKLRLYSRRPGAKRAFITRWMGGVKPTKRVVSDSVK